MTSSVARSLQFYESISLVLYCCCISQYNQAILLLTRIARGNLQITSQITVGDFVQTIGWILLFWNWRIRRDVPLSRLVGFVNMSCFYCREESNHIGNSISPTDILHRFDSDWKDYMPRVVSRSDVFRQHCNDVAALCSSNKHSNAPISALSWKVPLSFFFLSLLSGEDHGCFLGFQFTCYHLIRVISIFSISLQRFFHASFVLRMSL